MPIFRIDPFSSHYLRFVQVLFPNDGLVMLLARVIGILGPIDIEMLENGQETHKYFTEDYDLYFINEVCLRHCSPYIIRILDLASAYITILLFKQSVEETAVFLVVEYAT